MGTAWSGRPYGPVSRQASTLLHYSVHKWHILINMDGLAWFQALGPFVSRWTITAGLAPFCRSAPNSPSMPALSNSRFPACSFTHPPPQGAGCRCCEVP